MDVNRIIADLRAEVNQMNEAIAALERIAYSHKVERRGRPPAWLKAAKQAESGAEAAPKQGRGRPRKAA